MKTSRTLPVLAGMFLLLVSLAVPLHAQITWIGGSGTPVVIDDLNHYLVIDMDNWSADLAMNGTDDVTFDGTAEGRGVYIPYLTPPDKIGLHDIKFDSSSLTFSFRGNGTTSYLVLDGKLTATDSSTAVFNSDLAIQLTPGTHIADIGTNATITIASNISDYAAPSGIKKMGDGKLELSGANSFTGGVTLEAGYLLLGNSTALGTTAGTLTLNGGTLAPIDHISLANNVALNSSVKLGDCDTEYGITFTGTISGTGAFDTHGSGDIVFSGNNTWTGGIAFYGANHVYVNHANALGTGAVHFDSSSDTVLNIASGINASIGSLSGGDSEYDAEIHLDSTASLKINQTVDGVYGGAISGYDDGSTDGGLVKNGSATLTLSGPNSYHGPTIINAGALVADGADNDYQLGHGAVTINTGATLQLKDTYLLNSTVAVESGGKLIGSGNIGDGFMGSATTVKSGGVLSPGVAGSAPIGTLTFDHLTMQSGAIYEWNLQDPNGLAGSGWDLVAISTYAETLHIDSTLGSKMTLKATSLNGSGAIGAASGFMEYHTYSWKIFDGGDTPIAYANGSFDPLLFNVDTSGFLTDVGTGTGIFSLTADTYSIYLNFTPVPEPSTYALMALGLMGTGFAAWRKRRRA